MSERTITITITQDDENRFIDVESTGEWTSEQVTDLLLGTTESMLTSLLVKGYEADVPDETLRLDLVAMNSRLLIAGLLFERPFPHREGYISEVLPGMDAL